MAVLGYRARSQSVLRFVLKIFITILMIAIILASFYPIIWMFLNSFKSNTEIFQRPLGLPEAWDFSVFGRAWVDYAFAPAVMNSILVTTSVVLINILVSSMAAFATSHLQFIGKNGFLSFCIGCQVVSGQVLLVPLYRLLVDTHLYNTRIGLILAMAAFSIPMSMYLLTGFFKGTPEEIFESAKMDGCGKFRYLVRILIPISKPIIASVAIFQALFAWNEYIFTLTFLRDSSKWTVQPLIKSLFSGYSQQYNVNFAALSIVVIPILVLYICLQKYFIRGLTAGAIKG